MIRQHRQRIEHKINGERLAFQGFAGQRIERRQNRGIGLRRIRLDLDGFGLDSESKQDQENGFHQESKDAIAKLGQQSGED